MNREEQIREKEIKRTIYEKSEQIRILKKELSMLRNELRSLGDYKERRQGYEEEGPRLVKKKQR